MHSPQVEAVARALDWPALVARRVRAILDYPDYRPFEAAFVRGVLQPRG
jgi:hypothetical protein